MHVNKSAHHILHGGRHEEMLLLEAQLLAFICAVIRIQHAAERLSTLLAQNSGHIVTSVERLQIEFLGRLCSPQPQVDAVASAKARDGVVISNGCHHFTGIPLERLLAIDLLHAYMTVKPDGVADNQALNLPGVAKGEPVVRLLMLEAIDDILLEHAILVPDAVTPCGQAQCGHRVEETRRQTAQTPIAQGSITLLLCQVFELEAHLPKRLCIRLSHIQVVYCVEQRAAHEELHAQIVHTLGVLLLEVGLCVVP
mmetsp:Transcript_19396/g.33516  ORF Transcript_19396/g.33516 Transcript_19396/m.33516 type:complete len:254 (+) Transcript_19396:2084-2845(+)